MKIFFIWPNTEAKLLIRRLEAAGHTITYWVCDREDLGSRSDIILHEHHEAWDGKPAEGALPDLYSPPGRDLIEKFLRTESLVLTMMDKRFDKLGVNERRHLYYNMLGYWDAVLERYCPDAVIFPTPPHTVYNFILFNLAKSRGIKTVMFENPWVTDRALTYHDYEEGSPALKDALKRNAGKRFTLADLSPDLQEYYRAKTGRDPVPLYMKHQKSSAVGWRGRYRTLIGALQSIKAGRFLKSLWFFIRKHSGQNLRKDYRKLQQAPDFSSKFVYLPLGFQPERSSSPQAGLFVDQILMTEIVSAALSAGWRLYVKEHPSQWWLRGGATYSSNRYRGYYERLRAIKNVQLVPVETNTFDLIAHCRAVASFGGTAGWEAALRGKPSLNFGYPWYKDMPEIFNVFDVQSARSALAKIEAGFTISPAAVFRFLKSYEEATFHGALEILLKKDLSLTLEEYVENVSDAIMRELS